MVPGWFFHGFLWFQVGFSWFFMVQGGFSWFWVGFSWFQVCFSWFQVGFPWFFPKIYRPEMYPGRTIQSRSAARRAAQDLVIKSKNCKDDFSRRISVLCGWCLRDMRPLVFIYHHIFPRQNCTLHVGDSDSNLHVKYCIAKAVQYCSLSASVISPWFKYHNLSTIVNKCHKGFLITLSLTSSVFTKKLSLPLSMS